MLRRSMFRCRFRYGLLLLVTAAFLAGGCGGQARPRAVNGVLDLSAWDFAAGGTVRLDGEWEFYWRRLLAPQDFERGEAIPAPGLIEAPGTWNGHQAGGEAVTGDGYATYRLRVRLKDPGGPLALHVPYMRTAYRLWIDGEQVAANGKVGTSRGTMVPQYLPQTVLFTPRGETVQLVVQVSNFRHRSGGMRESIEMGTVGGIARKQERGQAFRMALFGAILVMALYHFGLYILRRRDRSSLYFGLFCLLFAVRILVTGEMLLVRMFPDFNWEAHLRIEYLTGYLVLPVFVMLLHHLYPRETSVWAVRLAQAAGALGIVSLPMPVRQSSLLIPPYNGVIILFVLYSFYVLVAAVRRRREGSGLFLAGGAFFLAMTAAEVLGYNAGVLPFPVPQLTPPGLFVLILAQSMILAQRFTKAFTELQHSRRLLTEREEHLREEIAEMLHGRVQTRLLLAGRRLEEVEGLVESEPSRAKELLAAAREEVEQVREEDVRQASHLLHPSIIRVGLVPAVRSLVGRFADRFHVDVDVDPRLAERDAAVDGGLPEAVRLAAYRVLEEALGNVHAHAGADRVVIRLGITPTGYLDLSVRDDGRGIDPDRLEPGLGLRSIAARVAEMGGTWEISGRPGSGTTLAARLPL